MKKIVENCQSNNLESRVVALEAQMIEVKAELETCPRISEVEDVDTIANDLLLSAVRDARGKTKADN